MSSQLVTERAAELFAKAFGRAPQWAAAAPGRVNLIGEHTDYNDGYVLPMAIERYTVIVAHKIPEKEVTLHNETTGDTTSFSVRGLVQKGEPSWSNYVRGVFAGFQRRGFKIPGFRAVIDSDLPYGGGLASSAALEVATATLLEAICGEELDPIEKALLCQKAEHEFASAPCGIMDQFTSIFGQANHALLLDCRSQATTPVLIKDAGVTVLIINTNTRHRIAETEYAKRRSQCQEAAACLGVTSLRDATRIDLMKAKSKMGRVIFRRAHHVITENERTLLACEALQKANWCLMGELMYSSHASLRDDYEVSSPELDAVVEIATSLGESKGMMGCRMTGAGFGGCAVSLVRTESVRSLTRRIQEDYEEKMDNAPTIFATRPAAGARVLKSAGK